MILKTFKFKKIKSTNDTAIKKIKKGIDNGIVISLEQTKGRGQYGKQWVSKKGNLFITIFYKIKNHSKIRNLTKKNFTLLINIIKFFLKQRVKIKLPNDIIVNKKKLCGVLHETIFFKNSRYLIMGMGININNSPRLSNYPTTFMNKYLKKKIGINEIFRKIKNEFELYLNDNSW